MIPNFLLPKGCAVATPVTVVHEDKIEYSIPRLVIDGDSMIFFEPNNVRFFDFVNEFWNQTQVHKVGGFSKLHQLSLAILGNVAVVGVPEENNHDNITGTTKKKFGLALLMITIIVGVGVISNRFGNKVVDVTDKEGGTQSPTLSILPTSLIPPTSTPPTTPTLSPYEPDVSNG